MRRALLALLLAVCALPASARADLIVGGREASPGEYPYAVYLEAGVFACGGSLVDARWVLTAAHCADSLVLVDDAPAVPWPGPAMTAYVGSNEIYEGEAVGALRAVIHPRYDKPGARYDVALVELSRAVEVPTVKIAGAGEEELWAAGTTATIVGWGDTEEGADTGSETLREAEVPVIADADCQKAYAGNVTQFDAAVHLCAGLLGQGGVDACQGDSGGPLLVPAADGAFRVAGVTSWGEGCARKEYPGVYTRIGAPGLRDFVAQHVPAAVGSAPPPDGAATRSSGPAPAPAPGSAGAPASAPAPESSSPAGSKQARRPAACRKAKKAKGAKRKRLRRKCRRALARRRAAQG